jgi:hypothetical protein
MEVGMRHEYLIPTSDPDLFVTREKRLVHRVLGQLKNATLPPGISVTLPGGRNLQIFWEAPPVHLEVLPETFARLTFDIESTEAGQIIGQVTKYMSDASGYLAVAQAAAELIDFLINLVDQTQSKIENIDRKLQTLLTQVGVQDYLTRQRELAKMRGNALAVAQTLDSIRTLIANSPPEQWYKKELMFGDHQLQADLGTLTDPSLAYFRRAYSEQAIIGDGWSHIIPDRPVQSDGTSFEFRLALPTFCQLMAVRVAMMKFTVPDFVSRQTFSAEINSWLHLLKTVANYMDQSVVPTTPTPIEIQCTRRQSEGGERIGSFSNWDRHCTVLAPYSVSPVGAVDITTGFGNINWQYTQFDEWYLGQGDLHGAPAGYWPPSVGPNYYQPPPQATGLPDYQRAIHDYNVMAHNDGFDLASKLRRQIGSYAATMITYQLFDLLYPGVSDIRLKQDIVRVGRLDNRLGLYRYRYHWSDQLYVGVIAQEVATVMPYAVARGPDGYLRVNYGRIGRPLMTWEEWLSAR